nr:cupin domain-containing protein [Cytophagales bacterium]
MSKEQKHPTSTLQVYTVGEVGERPWGVYEVIALGTQDDGQEFCEKRITLQPKQILSLQSHKYRTETWRVLEGTLDVIINTESHTLKAGEEITIPFHAYHCMANLDERKICIVHERQMGICREEDIVRYADHYGREKRIENESTKKTLHLYDQLRSKL